MGDTSHCTKFAHYVNNGKSVPTHNARRLPSSGFSRGIEFTVDTAVVSRAVKSGLGGATCKNLTTKTHFGFEPSSKRRKEYPSETQVKRGIRVVHGEKELFEKLGPIRLHS